MQGAPANTKLGRCYLSANVRTLFALLPPISSIAKQYFTVSPNIMQGTYDQDSREAVSSGGCSGGSSPAVQRAYYHRY